MGDTVLVLGGNGFIGFSVIRELVQRNVRVKCLDLFRPEGPSALSSVEYFTGDVWDDAFLQKALAGVDCVMDFVSTSMPNSNEVTLNNEIDHTLKYYDHILAAMRSAQIRRYVFPSSGGAVYGNKENGLAYETDVLRPTTAYGVGKKMAEDILQYYYDKCGISSCVLRIGNVYGSPRLRNKAQGVIDVFTQNALRGETITIWGSALTSVRDYVHLDDVARAIASVVQTRFDDYRVYNIGTGVGTNLLQIIELIEHALGQRIKCKFEESMASGLNSIVLSNEKIKREVGWTPEISLEEGIRKTISAKKALLASQTIGQS